MRSESIGSYDRALGFFLSSHRRERSSKNRLIYLVPLGGLSLSIGAVTLGVGLLGA